MADLVVASIHGVGPTRAGYADKMRQHVEKRFGRRVHFEEIRWAHLLEGRHRALLPRMEGGGKLRSRSMRKFVIAAVGESGAYREIGTTGHRLYDEVHLAIRDGLAQAEAAAGDVPLVVVAHSLGTVIASDHIWDEQHLKGRGQSTFQRCGQLAGFITMGSPLPLYTLAHKRIQAIDFPGPVLPPALREHAKWLNMYDPDDILGWPLRTTGSAYEQKVAEDIRVNIGTFLTSWNAMSHLGYWNDKDAHKIVANYVQRLLAAIDGEPLSSPRERVASARAMAPTKRRLRLPFLKA